MQGAGATAASEGALDFVLDGKLMLLHRRIPAEARISQLTLDAGLHAMRVQARVAVVRAANHIIPLLSPLKENTNSFSQTYNSGSLAKRLH